MLGNVSMRTNTRTSFGTRFAPDILKDLKKKDDQRELNCVGYQDFFRIATDGKNQNVIEKRDPNLKGDNRYELKSTDHLMTTEIDSKQALVPTPAEVDAANEKIEERARKRARRMLF